MIDLFFPTIIHILCNNICSECNQADAKTGEKITEHNTVGEDWVFAPCFSLRPWISEEWQIGHACKKVYGGG